MLSVNGRNCHVTWRIGVRLKQWKGAQSIELDRLSRTGYNHRPGFISVHDALGCGGYCWRAIERERDECKLVDRFFKPKQRGSLIVRLKAIKSREDIFCYLSFYHRSRSRFPRSRSASRHHHYLKPLILCKPWSHRAASWSRLSVRVSARVIAPSDRPQAIESSSRWENCCLYHRVLELLRGSLGA